MNFNKQSGRSSLPARIERRWLLAGALFLHGFAGAQTGKGSSQKEVADVRTLIVFFDGLRPDYITAEGMPRLYAFRQEACYGTQHHSVFPTVTRVNSSSYSTGSYPATHGLMGNTVYFPGVDKKKGLNTGEATELNRINSATHGHLLTAETSLGQVLRQAGQRFMVFSSGSTGQALLQNHTVSGITINPTMILPDSFRQQVVGDIGAPPSGGKADAAGHAWVTDALMKYGLVQDGPLVNAVWYSEPDGAAHQYGIGSPQARAALKLVDAQFGRILDSLKARKMDDKTNILISTDHGFATYIGKQRLADFLISQELKKDTTSEDVVVAEGAIYVNNHDKELTQKIVAALQGQQWAGPLFTKGNKPGDLKGWVAGTLSFEAVHWNHADRAADILTASNWDDSKNAQGYAGASYSTGVAGHGGLSPYEVHIPLMAAGPSFKKQYTDTLPTSNVDLVPTILHIHHLPLPKTMEGRVMGELLMEKGAEVKAPVAVSETVVSMASTKEGTYQIELHRTILGKYKYVDYATIRRKSQAATFAPADHKHKN
ncbi:MAG: alkaline phosphatase family protein [Williamsia sp.]|nr:alkaline phosphatase family protein [Williamsia sp.]